MGKYLCGKAERLDFVRNNYADLCNMVAYGFDDNEVAWLYSEGFIGQHTYNKIKPDEYGNYDEGIYQSVLREIQQLLKEVKDEGTIF